MQLLYFSSLNLTGFQKPIRSDEKIYPYERKKIDSIGAIGNNCF